MNRDSYISAAVREAKLRARTTGATYQSMLEDVARQAGAASWDDFLANPVAITFTTAATAVRRRPRWLMRLVPPTFAALVLLAAGIEHHVNP